MTSCTIIVYHYESLPFLRACIRQIRKYKHPEIEQHIIIADQSSELTQITINAEYEGDSDITIVQMKSICSGYSIDYIMRFGDIKTEYTCTMDVDAFPIHPNWIYIPIKLIEEYGFSFVGHHPDESGVTQWKRFEDAYSQYGKFFHVAQAFRVGYTKNFKELALKAGFTRSVDSRNKIDGLFGFESNQWMEIANKKGLDGYADSSVIAHWWEDQNKENNKFTFAETACLGIAPTEGRYGRVIDDLVFHFMFSYNYLQVADKQKSMGQNFLYWIEKINAGLTDELINEMLSATIPVYDVPRLLWDGKNKTTIPVDKALNEKITKLKST